MNAQSPTNAASRQEGKLIGLLLGGGYGLLTLLPDSHSWMVGWPWVLVWQVVALLPLLWLVWLLWYQRRWQPLGNGLDWGFGLLTVGLVISTVLAEFRAQSLWQGIAALGGVTAVYALTDWLKTPERRWQLWVWQGYLGIVMALWSLLLWSTQTLIPELQRLQELNALGLKLSLDLSQLELRNWAPFGHQNYVAGYFLLVLPLIAGLAVLERGRRRWIWLVGLGLGLLALYFTNSRGGWLGLAGVTLVLGIAAIWGGMKRARRWGWRLGLGLGSLLMVLGLGWSTTRLRQSFWGLLQGNESSELAYRWITANIGWDMGWTRPWSGLGLGSVPLLYQRYRPAWAGKEAEMAYQLHSTPVQAWAELGVWGILSGLVFTLVLLYWGLRWRQWWPNLARTDQGLVVVTGLALWGYGIISLTDYQLDNIGLSGALAVGVAGLAACIRQGLNQAPPTRSRWFHGLGWFGFVLLIASIIWVWPIQQAWNLSSQGFAALDAQPPKWERFVEKLDQAQAQAPWEPYYPLQLGWNFGWRSWQSEAVTTAETDLQRAIQGFQRGNQLAPYLEFGQSSLGWLLLRQDPLAAQAPFLQAMELMPTRPGIYLGLGLSLLANPEHQRMNLARDSLLLEGLRQPITITSRIWQNPILAPLYPTVLNEMVLTYRDWMGQFPRDTPMGQYVRQTYGVLVWWQGDTQAMGAILADPEEFSLSPDLADLMRFALNPEEFKVETQPQTLAQNLILAWLDEQNRADLLSQAWLTAQKGSLPESLGEALMASMLRAPNFDTWLRQLSPTQSVQLTRAGFGVLSRHIDGPQPTDFFVDPQNVVVSQILRHIWPNAYYLPPLDNLLQPQREALQIAVQAPGNS